MRSLLFLFFSFFISISYSQVRITEVFFDTPSYEYLEQIQRAIDWQNNNFSNNYQELIENGFKGEFVELYNYTSLSLNISGWVLSDNLSSYVFPNGSIIKPNSRIVILYRTPSQVDYYTSIFSTSPYSSDSVFYQNNIILNNFQESISLYMNMNYHGFELNNVLVDKFYWNANAPRLKDATNNQYGISNPYIDYSTPNINFYLPSLHKKVDGNYYVDIASPLDGELINPISFEDDLNVQQSILNVYNFQTWQEQVQNLLNKSCDDNIPLVDQSESIIPITKYCFNYDNNGNFKGYINCSQVPRSSSLNPDPDQIIEYSQDLINEIDSKIVLYPNPNFGSFTLNWDITVDPYINKVVLYSLIGNTLQTQNYTDGTMSVSFNVNVSSGTGFVKVFLVNSNQIISRTVLFN